MGMKASNAIATFFKYFVLILVGLIMIYPLLWMVSATFKDNSEIFAGISLWIKNPTLEGYRNALILAVGQQRRDDLSATLADMEQVWSRYSIFGKDDE